MTLLVNQVLVSVGVAGGTVATPVTGATAIGNAGDGINLVLSLTGPTGNGNGTYSGSFTAVMGRRYRWDNVDVFAHGSAHGRPLGGPLDVTAPDCPTDTTPTCPAGALDGDTSVSTSATIDSDPNGGFLDPGDPGSGTVDFEVRRDSDNTLMGSLSDVAVSGGTTGVQNITVSALDPGMYSIFAVFTPADVDDNTGEVRYASSNGSCGFTVGSSCDPVTMVTITSPTDGDVITADNCTDASVIVSAAADGSSPTFSYQLDVDAPEASSTLTVPLGQHTITVYADNECTTDPGVSASISVTVKANTVVTIDALPEEYATGSCERTVTGTLTDSCGTALEGETVTLLASIDGGTFNSVGSDDTDANGAWSVTWGGSENLPPGATVEYQASYDGNDSYFGDDSEVSDPIPVHYVWGGVGPPLSQTTVRKVKRGSTVPVKFNIYDCDGAEICTNVGLANGGLHTVALYYNANAIPYGEDTWEDAGSSSPSGNDFRYSGTCGDGQWIFNLNTGTALLNCTYKIVINLDDGSTQNVFISIVR